MGRTGATPTRWKHTNGDGKSAIKSDRAFNTYCMLAFLSVAITYFGVNLLLGGMHSYS